jgi:DNA ligase-like protein
VTDHDVKIADRYWTDMSAWSAASLEKPWSFQVNVLLISSYLYYQMRTQILSDENFDQLCAHLLKHFDEVMASNVWHKILLSRDALRAGTLFDLKESGYPLIISTIAYDLLRRIGADEPEEAYVSKPK